MPSGWNRFACAQAGLLVLACGLCRVPARAAQEEGVYKILCAGDSMAWGEGGRSFSDWLEAALRKKYPGLKFSVSSSWTGPRSVDLLQRLPQLLERERPSVLVAIAGAGNGWDSVASPRKPRRSGPYWVASRGTYSFGRGTASSCEQDPQPEGYDDSYPRRMKPWFEFSDPMEGVQCKRLAASGSGHLPAVFDYQLDSSALYLALGGYGKALERAQCAASMAPASPRPFAALADAYARQYYCAQAQEAANKAAELSSAYDWKTGAVNGYCSAILGDYLAAADSYRQALKKGIDQPSVYAGLCSAYADYGDYSGAAKACSDGQALFQDGSLLAASVRAKTLNGSRKEAFELLLRADKEPDAVRELAYEGFYGTLLDNGEDEEAEQYAARHAAGLKQPWLPKIFLARRYAAARNYERENAVLKEPRWQYPELPDIMLLDGDAAARNCEYDRAEEFYGKAADRAPEYWAPYFALGTLALRRDETGAAIAFLEKARSLAPSEPRVYRQLGRAYWRGREVRLSLEQYKKALWLNPHSQQDFAEYAAVALDAGQSPEEMLAVAAEVPGLSANPEYQVQISELRVGSATDTTWVSALQDSLSQDMASVCSMGRKKKAVVIFSSYPDKELSGVSRAAQSCGAIYVNFSRLLRNKYKTRRDYISYDNFHPNSAGYRFMAQEYARIIGEQLHLDDKMNEDFE